MAMNPSLTVEDWNRLNRLLEQGLELEGETRTAWLESLGEQDRHLRAVLVDLLNRSDTAASAIAPPTGVARLASEALAAMRHEQAGDRLGPWRLERLLAEGGMGAVWEAARADGVMQRRAALKLPRAEWVDRGLAERIARERAILARLQHPAIAVLYDAGLAEGGRPYLALEYVNGVPIDAWCQGRALKEVLRLFVQVVRAVAYAHGQLVIHRDLKPANVLVTADGQPKLLDFGISKLIEGEASTAEATALTRLAGRPLTLAYAAPEQLLNLPITVSADVYALGVMLFELLTQSRLYRAQEPRSLEAELLRGDPRRPSDAAVDPQRARQLRGDLDAIVLTALKREPQDRYQSAAALADDLERYLTGAPVQARPDSRSYRLRKFVARNTLAVGAAGAIVLALGIGLGVALWQAKEAREQAQRATALNTFVLGLIRQADPNASAQTKAADVAMLNAIEQRIDTEFHGSPDQLLQLRITVGDAYRNRGETAAAQRVYQRAVDEAATKLRADDLQLQIARVRAADYNLIVSSAASESLDHAIGILRTKGAAGAEPLIDALLIRHELAHFFGVPAFPKWEQRFDTLNEAQDLALRHFGEGSRQHLRVITALAKLTSFTVNDEEGFKLIEPAIARAGERGGVASSPEYRDASAKYAELLCANGRAPEGLNLLWAAIAAERAAHGESSVQLERLLESLGACFNAVDDAAGAGGPFEAYKVAAARERPPSTNLMRRAEETLNWSLGARDFATAERYYRSAMENSKAIVDPAMHERLTRGLAISHVCILVLQGESVAAERAAAPLIAWANAEFAKSGRISLGQDGLWNCLSQAQREQGRHEEAIRTAQTYLDRCLTMKFKFARACARTLTSRAAAELESGRPADAMKTLQQQPELESLLSGTPSLQIAYGRALLATGQPAKALEVFRVCYGEWLTGLHARGPWAAEAEYWFGQAWIANGDAKRGRRMVAEAKQVLKNSRMKSHQALAARAEP